MRMIILNLRIFSLNLSNPKTYLPRKTYCYCNMLFENREYFLILQLFKMADFRHSVKLMLLKYLAIRDK